MLITPYRYVMYDASALPHGLLTRGDQQRDRNKSNADYRSVGNAEARFKNAYSDRMRQFAAETLGILSSLRTCSNALQSDRFAEGATESITC
jgi:hypothetical protein